jgi:hypothetical protein
MKNQKIYKSQEGQILLFTLVFTLIILSLVGALVGYAGVQIKSHRQAVAREKALSIAEAGVELGLWKLNNQLGYTGEANTSYGDGTFTIATTNLSSRSKLLKVDAYIPNQSQPIAHRQVQITVTIGVVNFGFIYGVQVGDGGLVMDNNTTVVGNVYSNGDIIGGNNNAVITGDVIVAGPTGLITKVGIQGNSYSHSITNSTVSKNANHYSLSATAVTQNANVHSLSGPGCSVGGNATYNTRSNCTVTGTATTPNSNVPTDAASQPLPISQTQIDAWTNEAAAGGSMSGGTISGTVNLGPIRVNGDLIIDGTINMTGTIWVTGNLTINNGAVIKLDSSYGPLGGEIIAGTSGTTTNGFIDIQNGATINGSGATGSYIMLLSQRDTTTNGAMAIRTANNVSAAVLYTNKGLVEVINNATLKEVTSWKLHLNNLTTIVYDSGFASAGFSEGPSGGWEMARQSWQLLR